MLNEIIHQQHLELRELFMQHQEVLLQARFHEAIASLAHFDARLAVHMSLEEKHLFPEFAGIDRKTKWDVSLYEMEHEKVKQLYAIISNDLEWLSEQSLNESETRRNIIALLDKEKTFKGLLEHHEDREVSAMLKELDEQLPESVLQELVLKIQSEWDEPVAGESFN